MVSEKFIQLLKQKNRTDKLQELGLLNIEPQETEQTSTEPQETEQPPQYQHPDEWKKIISFKASKEFIGRIDKWSLITKQNRSDLIRDAVGFYLSWLKKRKAKGLEV